MDGVLAHVRGMLAASDGEAARTRLGLVTTHQEGGAHPSNTKIQEAWIHCYFKVKCFELFYDPTLAQLLLKPTKIE